MAGYTRRSTPRAIRTFSASRYARARRTTFRAPRQISAAASPVVSSEDVLFIPPVYATTIQHGGFYLAEGCGKRVTYALDGDGRLILVAEVALQGR